MGLDFVKSKAGRPWRKSWANGVDALKAPTLFELPVSQTIRTVTVALRSKVIVALDEDLVAHLNGDTIDLCRELNVIGTINAPPEDAIITLAAHGGVCFARVKSVGLFRDTAEVEFR